MTIYAIDCDLRTSYCASEFGDEGRGSTPAEALAEVNFGNLPGDRVLFEIASPVSFNRQEGQHAAMTQLARWAIWNVAMAAFATTACKCPVLVAPSNVWTHGFDLQTRHAMAKATSRRKDLRDCQAMIFFYRHAPAKWTPLTSYLDTLRPT